MNSPIKFKSGNVFVWESVVDDHMEQAMDDPSEVAIVVDKYLDKFKMFDQQSMSAGNVDGAHGGVGLYIYKMEDDDWIYIAHFIYEVEYQCFLFRHKKVTE
jgi:hypothetical protein|tara:strand:+ start:4194 stop:4496 length:303 start_codon:yes stop_codon:yes gene_type:complete